MQQQLAYLEGQVPQREQAQNLTEPNSTSGQILARFYHYDKAGNLTQTQDKRFGTTNYRYDKIGQIQLAGQELFYFDPAHNLIESGIFDKEQPIKNNQLTEYQGINYQYDEFGNLKERIFPNGEVQHYEYNAKDQLIKVIIQKPNNPAETWQYQYDVLGRRISKRLENGEHRQETRFVWDGSHLVQEENAQSKYSYIYTHPNSYEPLAQLEWSKNSKNLPACHYYHTDQIGIPRELTDENGELCWYGDYTGWGKLKNSFTLKDGIHQPFRLQNQYCDSETGLHYNFFRYYEPNIGRFTQLDPIGLAGGDNLYAFAPNTMGWIDPLGLARFCTRPLHGTFGITTDLDKSYRGGLDLGLFHEHIFFDDGTNIGYTTTGTFSETSKIGYKCSNVLYDDEKMKEAVKMFKT